MPGTIAINEVRIQLETIKNLSVFKCSHAKISMRHKKKIETKLRITFQRVSIFEGDVIFILPNDQNNFEDEQQLLFSYLSNEIHNLQLSEITLTKLQSVPERVIERLIFAMISFQASNHGVYTIFGQTLFEPTPDINKSAHLSLDITSAIDDNYLRFYLDPSYVALINILESDRENFDDTKLIGLCKYRTKKTCSLVNKYCSCECLPPGKLGYYGGEINKENADSDSLDFVTNQFSACPHFSQHTNFVKVKASKNSLNSTLYPSYVVFSRLSRMDLSTKKEIQQRYRQATLMTSEKRLKLTLNWILRLFEFEANNIQKWGKLRINQIEFPVENVLSIKHTSSPESSTGIYKTNYIPDMQIINDSNNPKPYNLSGGWLFTNRGAFDRRDPNRPFSEIAPHLIIPDNQEKISSCRHLINYLTNGKYQARNKFDRDFQGINLQKDKYNTIVKNSFDEEDIEPVSESIESYEQAAKNILRQWKTSSKKDNNKHVIVVIPGGRDTENNPYYFRTKKILIEGGIPSTFITFETLSKLQDTNTAFGPILDSLWLNIYSKMGGKPWRLSNSLGNVHCFIGIGFGINPNNIGNHIFAGIAHVFDKYGSWIDIASDSADLSQNELESFSSFDKYTQGSSSFKISQNVSQSIIYNALQLYKQKQTKTHENATNIVLHKLGKIYECEILGFLEGIRQVLGSLGNCKLGILQIEQEHNIRLYGDNEKTPNENNTIYKGSILQLHQNKLVLASTGRYNRHTSSGVQSKYPGIGTPKPLVLTSVVPNNEILKKFGITLNQFYDIEELTNHTMALTQLHWGSTRDNIRLPITTLYAKKVADLISKTDLTINDELSYFRPWFL